MSTSLDGKTALVTGAGRGLGRPSPLGVASAGGTVALVARSAGELPGTAWRVQELGGARSLLARLDSDATGQVQDVSDPP
jgi:NAD(P)-dependent dehydrogenase (short-subunit alcohol dehydrogenase family)